MDKFVLFNAQKGFVHFVILALFLVVVFVGIYIIKNPDSVLSSSFDTNPPHSIVQFNNTVKDNIFTCSAEVVIACTDDIGGSGCDTAKSPKYCIDTADKCIPQFKAIYAPILISQEGNGYIRYQSQDLAGNVEAIKSTPIIIDRTPPSMRLDTAPSTVAQKHQYTWHLQGVSDVSGIAKVECYWDDQIIGSPIYAPNLGTGYVCTILIPSDATTSIPHNVTAKVYDNAGWYKSDTTTVTVNPY